MIEEHRPEGVIYYTWDANGNLVKKEGLGEVWEYEWDYDNKLLRALLNGEEVVRYVYDYEGNKVKEIKNTQEIDFLVDSNNLTGYYQIFKELSSDKQIIYIFGDDLLAQTNTNGKSFYHYDHLGSCRFITNISGEFIESFSYYAFGKSYNSTISSTYKYLFTGERFEKSLDLYYLRARYLDSNTGRFISLEPYYWYWIYLQNLNNYVYVSNNPINKVDYSGLQAYSLTEIWAGFGIQQEIINIELAYSQAILKFTILTLATYGLISFAIPDLSGIIKTILKHIKKLKSLGMAESIPPFSPGPHWEKEIANHIVELINESMMKGGRLRVRRLKAILEKSVPNNWTLEDMVEEILYALRNERIRNMVADKVGENALKILEEALEEILTKGL